MTLKLKTNDWYGINEDDFKNVPTSKAGTIDVTQYPAGTTLQVWKGETGTRPRSEVQRILIP